MVIRQIDIRRADVEFHAATFVDQGDDLVGIVHSDGAFGKDDALFFHLFGFFLTHGSTQHVGSAETVTGQYLGDLHDLFLVQDDTIGGL